MKKKITKSSGNVFVDLGFDPAEAAVLQMRSNLIIFACTSKSTSLVNRKRLSGWVLHNRACRTHSREMGKI